MVWGKEGKSLLRKRGSGCTLHSKPLFKEMKHKDKTLGAMDFGDSTFTWENCSDPLTG